MNKELPFEIVVKPAFRIIGIRIETTNHKKEGTRAIPKLWEEVSQTGRKEQLLAMRNKKPFGLFGINVYNIDAHDPKKFHYYIGCVSEQAPQEDMVSYEVFAGTWAVFPCSREHMGKVQVQAIMKWIPKSAYRVMNKGYITGKMKAPFPDIEHYLQDDRVEIWVAVEKK